MAESSGSWTKHSHLALLGLWLGGCVIPTIYQGVSLDLVNACGRDVAAALRERFPDLPFKDGSAKEPAPHVIIHFDHLRDPARQEEIRKYLADLKSRRGIHWEIWLYFAPPGEQPPPIVL